MQSVILLCAYACRRLTPRITGRGQGPWIHYEKLTARAPVHALVGRRLTLVLCPPLMPLAAVHGNRQALLLLPTCRPAASGLAPLPYRTTDAPALAPPRAHRH